ncbi:preprotein translocase subunit SecE [Patescibacteria group bacterium]|nr:preprotein translocase subunit SecE [Patescibacteria group bacterium]
MKIFQPIIRLITFLREVRTEARKVNWPTRRETLVSTGLVVGFSLVVAALLGLFDLLFTTILERFII